MNGGLAPFFGVVGNTLAAFYVLLIFAAPIILGVLCFQGYLAWKRNKFIHDQKKVVLEIRLPQEVMKSPLAMELFLTSLYQTKGEGTWIKRYVYGQLRPYFSLELTSIGGEIKFFIWTWQFWQHHIESQLYAQYPDIEIKEAPDYAQAIHLNLEKYEMWGCNFKLQKPDCYPIKSYVDYQLDKDPKEELKIDPMTPVFEYLGGLKPGEQAWIQIIIRAHKKERPKPGSWFKKVDWSEEAKAEIEKIKTKDTQQVESIKLTGLSLTKGEKDMIEAIERNVAKIPFDCGIRAIYIAEKDKWNDINISGLNGSFRQYNSFQLNGFQTDKHHITEYNYPWQNITGKRLMRKKHHIFEEYQHRAYFHAPFRGYWFVLNTESLATIYHFPGQVAKSPALQRVPAKKSEPPANLPI
ncbi:MAG TPA: hypothetical protein VJH63_02030 [Candidatus Paceibacterota bacterium]